MPRSCAFEEWVIQRAKIDKTKVAAEEAIAAILAGAGKMDGIGKFDA